MVTTDSDKLSIGSRSLYAEWSGAGSPIIVLDAGGTGAGCWTGAWNTVWNELAGLSMVCRYDRANTGRSDPAPEPRTSSHMVADLRALLAAGDFKPPYVLVGHSFGGLVMQLYARCHPAEVAGLVLLDSVHPEQLEYFYEFSKEAGDGLLAETNAVLRGIDWAASAEQVRAAPALSAVPLVVITRGQSTPEAAVWNALQAELAAQVPGSRQIIAHNSGHGIQLDEPQAVIAALTWLLEEIRKHAN